MDPYLSAYQGIRLLAQRFPQEQLPLLSGVGPSVVAEYLVLIEDYGPRLELYAAVTERSQNAAARESTTHTPRPSFGSLEAVAASSRRFQGWRCKKRSAVGDFTGHMNLFFVRQQGLR